MRLARAIKTRGSLGLLRPNTVQLSPRPAGGLPRTTAPALGSNPAVPAATQAPATPVTYAPTPQGIPDDSVSSDAKIRAGQDRDNAIASIAQRQGLAQNQYGWNADGSVNTADPFSRRALLEKAYATQRNATKGSMAASGQLYSGALENQNQSDLQNSNASVNSAYNDFQNVLAGFAQEGAQVGRDYNTAIINATSDYMNRHKDDTPGPDPGTVDPKTGQVLPKLTTPTGRSAFGGPLLAQQFNQLTPVDQRGYQAYLSAAAKSNVKALLPGEWLSKGKPTATLEGRGSFGGGALARQFNGLAGPDQQAYIGYFAKVGSRRGKALTPSQWVAAGKPGG